MEELKIQEVQIQPDSLRAALKNLNETIRRHTEMKRLLERVLSLQSRKGLGGASGRRGRRPGGGKTLRQAIVEVLKSAKVPLKPVELRDRILDSGYETRATSQSFYTAVFNTARKEPGVQKTDAGFRWKGERAGAKPSRRRKKAKAGTKKGTRKKAGRTPS